MCNKSRQSKRYLRNPRRRRLAGGGLAGVVPQVTVLRPPERVRRAVVHGGLIDDLLARRADVEPRAAGVLGGALRKTASARKVRVAWIVVLHRATSIREPTA